MFKSDFELAKKVVAQAAGLLMETRVEILSSDCKDIKLSADLLAENCILSELDNQSVYPVLSEEAGMQGTLDEDNPYWVVDPLDGTFNFSRGIPFSCVSVALWQGSAPVLGVVYDFARDELFAGQVGVGAWLNDKPIEVSNVDVRGQAVLATGFPSFRSYEQEALLDFVTQVQDFKKVRLFGAAALSMAYVASGRVDAYCEEGIMFWDVAAGIALVKAAGGNVEYKYDLEREYAMSVWAASQHSLLPGQNTENDCDC